MRKLENVRVVITGVGIKPIGHVFHDIITGEPSHTAVFDSEGTEYKANIGAATAYECVKQGAIVHIVSRTEKNLQIVKNWIEKDIPEAKVEMSAVDLSDEEQIKNWVQSLHDDKALYWVQSAGIGAGTVKIKDDQPYTKFEDSTMEQLDAELSILKNTFAIAKALMSKFEHQQETRIAIISSMAAIRSFTQGAIHCASKGGLSRFINALMLDVNKRNIFISDIRPGLVDTGAYDSDIQMENGPIQGGKGYGYDYTKENIPMMSAGSVGEIIADILASKAHITSVNMVARGQWPHEHS